MKEKRQKSKKRLSSIDAELFLLEREKSMVSNTMVDIENEVEIKKRVKLKKSAPEEASSSSPSLLTQKSLASFNQLFFEMKNLPLEYVLAQSSKIVLTAEWILSLMEREWIEKLESVKKMMESKTFLEEKNKTQFTEIETKRRAILQTISKAKEKGASIGKAQRKERAKESVFSKICAEKSLEKKDNEVESRYKKLLSLFALMKANKSAVRLNIPQSKKTTSSMHSSHTACLEKLRAEIGKIYTIPELAKYRQCKKLLQEGQGVGSTPQQKGHKQAQPIMYSGADESIKLSTDLEEDPFSVPPSAPGEKEKQGCNNREIEEDSGGHAG
ncbi:hypothetical protein NECID01_0934 [Nematocida sp. AWRm77]|nr:hypothetical protein NECID01_0934 [Nematocida sp. AWRm77]